MKQPILRIVLGLGSVFSLFASTASATNVDLYNNLAATSYGNDNIGSYGSLADSFSTGSTGFHFTSLTLFLDVASPSTGTITASLLSDSSTSPGTTLETIGTLSETGLTGPFADYSFSTAYLLAANTRYWIELSDSDNGGFWSWSTDVSGTGVGNEFFANQGGVFANNPNGPYQMQVSGIPTPEPGTLVLMGSGLLTLAGRIRRSKKA